MKIAMFAPYFAPPKGELPNYFEYWQKTAAANKDIDFFIPTNLDTSKYTKYVNIHYIFMTAEEFWAQLQSMLDFPICKGYYKTAEYRVFFGIIFYDIIKDYDYWGSTEFDVFYGDIMKFVMPYIKKGAEVIGSTGPFRLIKNTPKLRNMPFFEIKEFNYPLTLQIAYSTEYCWYFDELVGMNVRYHQAGVKVYSLDNIFADISNKYKYLSIVNKKYKWAFEWNNGKLYGYNEYGKKKEFLNAHFQKRKLSCVPDYVPDKFYIVPNSILNSCDNILSHIKVNSFWYTFKICSKKYTKYLFENHREGKNTKQIREELNRYCTDNGISPTKTIKNPIVNLLYKIKRKILWV